MRRREFIALLSAVTGWPLLAIAQQSGRVSRIAIVHPSFPISELNEQGENGTLFIELRKLGYTEGHNVTFERYSGEGQAHRSAELAKEVVATKPDLIITWSRRLVQHFKNATRTIPVIAAVTLDPVGHGVAASLARPGGNITGFTSDVGLDVLTKHIQLLQEVAPGASRIAFLAPDESWSAPYGQQMLEAAKRTGVTLLGPALTSPIREAEYRRVFAEMAAQSPDALLVGEVTDNHSHARLIVELTGMLRVPAIHGDRRYVEHGGLMAYATDRDDRLKRVAAYTDRILKGENPGDLPFQQPTKVDLIINLRTARVLGLTIPPTLLARADEVIE